MSSAYRSAYDHIVGLKLAETRDARAQLAPLLPGLRTIARARIARIVAGSVGIAGAAAMVFSAATTHDDSATTVLVGSSAALVLAWGAARAGFGAAGRIFPRELVEPKLSGQLDADIARIAETDPRRELAEIEARASRLEQASIALPLVGITLLLPLLLHWLFVLVVDKHETAKDFAEWIRISLVVVGHAHIALAICCCLFARKLRHMSVDALMSMRIHREWAKAWLITIGVSSVAGIILFCVPPILVAITSIVFVPFMFMLIRKSVLAERHKIAIATTEVGLAAAAEHTIFSRVAEPELAPELPEQEEGEADRYYEDASADSYNRAQG